MLNGTCITVQDQGTKSVVNCISAWNDKGRRLSELAQVCSNDLLHTADEVETSAIVEQAVIGFKRLAKFLMKLR